ncbi:MAG TPA: four helix bundle protein [Candidatus Paceibacterota bacterium]|nr:four helix bundle protein [Candidatus Paceibacterota bacterium]
MQTYRDLIVWQRSIELVTAIYQLTNAYPKSELFGLTSQMRRAAVSIPSNIAEGYARKSRKEYIQFLRIAELETQLTITRNLALVTEEKLKVSEALLNETMRLLNKFISSLTSKP